MRRTVLLSALALLALGCGAGASTQAGSSGTGAGAPAAAETKAPTTVKVGETLTLVEDVLGAKTTVEITVSKLRANVKSGNQFIKPGKGQFVVVDVAVLVREGKFSINSSSFKLVAADGTAYDSTLTIAGSDLSANDLAPGQKTSGTVTFDAAKGAEKGAKIALTNVWADGDAGYWAAP